ncbi:hypothetical protein [Cupriavidus sp. TMH.W2]|uniref:hypothetical protein n=1 Tax=Cupriavidus sp. TMH.W2 TaxID=3434465 RepID=UPI003D788C1E
MDLNKLSPAKAQMVQDAIAAGYTAEHSDFCVDLIRYSRHATPRRLLALRLYETGTAFDALLDLSAAKAMRNVNEMRHCLGSPRTKRRSTR